MAVSRRRFLHAVAVAAAPFAFLARVQTLFGLSGDSVELEPTPAVGEQLELTAQETAGAFFQPDSSLKADFREAGLMGVRPESQVLFSIVAASRYISEWRQRNPGVPFTGVFGAYQGASSSS